MIRGPLPRDQGPNYLIWIRDHGPTMLICTVTLRGGAFRFLPAASQMVFDTEGILLVLQITERPERDNIRRSVES